MPPLRTGDEFPADASEWPEGLSRRRFLELMGASLALAGLGACNRPPAKTIVPYIVPPGRDLLDASLTYATAMPWEGFGQGLLALSSSGRPTKLEGNPAHPDSLGAADILMQAAVLGLYDPDRSAAPRQGRHVTSWRVFEEAWLTLHRDLSARHGAGLALLTEPTTSPTLLRAIHHLLDRFPQARWYQHTPLPRYDVNGEQEDFALENADIVLAIDADFLGSHPSRLRYARAFTRRRRVENGHVDPNRLYALEPAPSLTGEMADHALAASPTRIRRLLDAVEAAFDRRPSVAGLTAREEAFVTVLASDLRQHAPRVLCVAGDHVDDDVRRWTTAMNARLGADGVTRFALPAVRSDGDERGAGNLPDLVAAMNGGGVETIVIVGTNPAYSAPAELRFPDALQKVRHRIHSGMHVDETAVRCDWHVPQSHFLESWDDIRAFDGTASIIQPLIAPLYESRGAAEFVFFLADATERTDYDLVRETWQEAQHRPDDFEARWARWLGAGVIEDTSNRRHNTFKSSRAAHDQRQLPPAGGGARGAAKGNATSPLTLVLRPDPTIRDGRWANNGWLQELPKPGSQLVWDNAAYVAPAFAAERHLENGDLIEVVLAGSAGRGEERRELVSPALPIWIAPGLAADCVLVHLGYGRTQAGRVGNGRGFNAYLFRRFDSPWAAEISAVRTVRGRYQLVSTQRHFAMEGRELIRTATAAEAGRARPEERKTLPSLYPDWSYEGYRWGMSIDLSTCIGCQACIIACQAENNIPVVGKDQVSRGREMHWIRVDRYLEGDPAQPQVRHQPVPCMQCENAPCELVCPVAATVHSSEGLNDMVYNRCIGTRYCSNNCPYKVRRFNFLDYREPKDSTLYLQKNPEVTVRARGVMEKCTYCVQRIDAARIVAERDNRRIRDGEVRTACQQACPTEAIVFGDLNDPASRVRARKAEPTHYTLLEELNTRPRTTYLAKITNSNPEVQG